MYRLALVPAMLLTSTMSACASMTKGSRCVPIDGAGNGEETPGTPDRALGIAHPRESGGVDPHDLDPQHFLLVEALNG